MAGLFFPRKSKNGAGKPADPPPASPDAQPLYEPLAAGAHPAPLPVPAPDPALPDLYAVLGVDPRASDDVIRYSYRKKAARLHDARWRPGRAARQLAELNAAYEILGKPDRRADYDRQRARHAYYRPAGGYDGIGGPTAPLPQAAISGAGTTARTGRVPAGRALRLPRGLLELVVIVGVLAVAVYAGYTFMSSSASLVDLSAIRDAGAAFGLPVGGRPAAPVASPTAIPVLPTPTPRQVIVPAAPTSAPAAASPAPVATRGVAESVRATARVNNPAPARRTEIGVIMRLTRDNQPLRNVPVYAIAHYRTVDERFPENNGTVATNDLGEATITFNIGDATAGFPVNVDVIAAVDGEEVKAQTSFVPR